MAPNLFVAVFQASLLVVPVLTAFIGGLWWYLNRPTYGWPVLLYLFLPLVILSGWLLYLWVIQPPDPFSLPPRRSRPLRVLKEVTDFDPKLVHPAAC